MISCEDLFNDPRFYIDKHNLNRIAGKAHIYKYKIIEIPVGKILRLMDDGSKRFIPLNETVAFKYLDGSDESKQLYSNYCNKSMASYRTEECYKHLLGTIIRDGYDIKRGGIFKSI